MGQRCRAPVVIGSFPNEFAAAMARNTLLAEGIPCEMLGIHTAGFRAEAPGEVKVMVPADREAEARAILEGVHAEEDEGFEVEGFEDEPHEG